MMVMSVLHEGGREIILYAHEVRPTDAGVHDIYPAGHELSFYVGGGGFTGSMVTSVTSVGAVPVEVTGPRAGASYPSGTTQYLSVTLVAGAELLVHGMTYVRGTGTIEWSQRIRCDEDCADRFRAVELARARARLAECEAIVAKWTDAKTGRIDPAFEWDAKCVPVLRAEIAHLSHGA